MRHFLFLTLCLVTTLALSEQWEEQELFEGNAATETLRVISSTDTAIFAPIIKGFIQRNPRLNVEYLVAGSSDIYHAFQQSPEHFDVLISSAMDLQLKLVNDGYARKVEDIVHPDWAQWRQSLFGFTLEPAAIVINKKAFGTLPVPQSRQEMIQVLRANPHVFRGRIGTYDVRQSGLGYLFATQDARRSETYWRLMELMGGLDATLYCCSSNMIEDVANGTIAIAYNVLGSYATARSDLANDIEIILPDDFPTLMMRTAMVSAQSSKTVAATQFVRYLASSSWSGTVGTPSPLPPLNTAAQGDTPGGAIALEPGLMIFLDRMKRRIFVQEWESAIIQ